MKTATIVLLTLILSSFILFTSFIQTWFGMNDHAYMSAVSREYKQFSNKHKLVPVD